MVFLKIFSECENCAINICANWGNKTNEYFWKNYFIPRSRQNPEIPWADDAKIIGDGVAQAVPVLGDFAAQEIERGVRELSACGVAFVVRDIPMHEAP